jgi:hypothetical protein
MVSPLPETGFFGRDQGKFCHGKDTVEYDENKDDGNLNNIQHEPGSSSVLLHLHSF